MYTSGEHYILLGPKPITSNYKCGSQISHRKLNIFHPEREGRSNWNEEDWIICGEAIKKVF